MKKFFRRRSETYHTTRGVSEAEPQSHSESSERSTVSNQQAPLMDESEPISVSIADSDTVSLRSLALSEAETLANSRDASTQLQDTYQENFTSYIPFLLRRQRAEQYLAPFQEEETVEFSDDDRTIYTEDGLPPIMHRDTSQYNYRRSLIIASELIKNTTFVFPNMESFEIFKHLRSNSRKIRKSSIVLYDENDEVRRVDTTKDAVSDNISATTHKNLTPNPIPQSPRMNGSFPEEGRDRERLDLSSQNMGCTYSDTREDGSSTRETDLNQSPRKIDPLASKGTKSSPVANGAFQRSKIDSRVHIVPPDYKVRGHGLPIFKVVVPYMSSFRRKTPYMVFRKYLEKPKPPLEPQSGDNEDFETYDFCTVHLKTSQHYKRYIFEFQPEGEAPFKVIAFQNTYRPFTDFNYKSTRFRVFGTSITMAYLTQYNPELKLHVLDKDQPSLMDGLIDKKTEEQGISGRRKKPKSSRDETNIEDHSSSIEVDDLQNPVPNPNNPILLQNLQGNSATFYRCYVPAKLPPFGRFTDACAYLKSTSILPRKYSEVGKIEVYQNPTELENSDVSLTLSVDVDSLVLCTVFLALRETNIRTTVKHSSHGNISRMNLFTTITLSGGSMVCPPGGA